MCIYWKRACLHCSYSGPGPPWPPSAPLSDPMIQCFKKACVWWCICETWETCLSKFFCQFFCLLTQQQAFTKKKAKLLFYCVFLPKQKFQKKRYLLTTSTRISEMSALWETRFSLFSLSVDDLSNSTIICTQYFQEAIYFSVFGVFLREER